MASEQEAERQFKDDIAKLSIDQLHKAVLQFSGNCFELKKLCVTVLVSAGTLIATFTQRQLDTSIFVAGATIILFFWILDAQSYYYQEKLRAEMKNLAEEIAARHKTSLVVEGIGMPLTEERENWRVRQRSIHAAFNGSMAFYLLLVLLVLVTGVMYWWGMIASSPVPA
jgi:hypothetical protein